MQVVGEEEVSELEPEAEEFFPETESVEEEALTDS